jgi:hypothetical protein
MTRLAPILLTLLAFTVAACDGDDAPTQSDAPTQREFAEQANEICRSAKQSLKDVAEGAQSPEEIANAVDRVIEEKLRGPYGSEEFAQARARTHPPEAIAYAKEICRYLVETYGRFPAHTDPFHLPGIWVQFSHLEIEYYERFGHPGHTRRGTAQRPLRLR